MYATILVPLDGSRRAEAILPHVESLAGCFGSRLVLLQVVEPVRIPLDPHAYLPDLDEQLSTPRQTEASVYLSHLQDRLCSKGIETRIRVVLGPVVESIIHTAQEENAGLITMASHGRGGLSRMFYGSVADGVLQRIDRPLFLIRSIEASR